MFKNKKAEAQPFENYIGIFLLASLFLLSIYGFATSIGERYDKNLTIDDKQIDLTRLEEKIDQTTEDAEKWQEAVRDDKPDIYLAVLVLLSIWGVIKLMWFSVIGLLSIIVEGAYNVLGIPPLALGVVITLLIIGLIFAAYRKWKTGQ